MFPTFKSPQTTEDFAAECRKRFVLHCQAVALAPFHKDKRRYAEMAWAEVDAYLDWLDIEGL